MFGIGFFEFLVIGVVAIVFLGPDKLPEAMVKIVKMFKTFSKSINEAKSAIEEELNIQELKEDSQKYRALLEQNTQKLKKEFSLEDLSILQDDAQDVNAAIKADLKIDEPKHKSKTEPKNDKLTLRESAVKKTKTAKTTKETK